MERIHAKIPLQLISGFNTFKFANSDYKVEKGDSLLIYQGYEAKVAVKFNQTIYSDDVSLYNGLSQLTAQSIESYSVYRVLIAYALAECSNCFPSKNFSINTL